MSHSSSFSVSSPDLSSIPPEYHDLGKVFSKERAISLPPHRPYDCSTDLIQIAVQYTCNLSHPEREAMESYIRDSFAAGLIRPSSSPLGVGFFFVSEKNKALRSCSMYDITIKNHYPLLLIYPSFEPLIQAAIFTKLDLRNAYHLVRIRERDKWKTAFKTPLGHFEYLVMPLVAQMLQLFSRP